MLIQHFARESNIFAVDLVALELAVVVNSDHVIDKTVRRHFRGEFAVSAIPSACNSVCFFDFPVEVFTMLIKEIQMRLWQTETLRQHLEFFWDLFLR